MEGLEYLVTPPLVASREDFIAVTRGRLKEAIFSPGEPQVWCTTWGGAATATPPIRGHDHDERGFDCWKSRFTL
eukprot:scaffold46845_cov146-Skeletonema_marinoi.AAC.1